MNDDVGEEEEKDEKYSILFIKWVLLCILINSVKLRVDTG